MSIISTAATLFDWGYALVGFLINDGVKLVGYRILDPKGVPVIAQRGAQAAA